MNTDTVLDPDVKTELNLQRILRINMVKNVLFGSSDTFSHKKNTNFEKLKMNFRKLIKIRGDFNNFFHRNASL